MHISCKIPFDFKNTFSNLKKYIFIFKREIAEFGSVWILLGFANINMAQKFISNNSGYCKFKLNIVLCENLFPEDFLLFHLTLTVHLVLCLNEL